MSDFGADTCDFHSDFASDFRAESNDYASDFRDFPGDFGGASRTAKQPPETPDRHRRSRGQPPTRPQGHKGGGKLAAHAASRSAGDNTTPQGHKQGPQNTRGYGGIGIATNIKTPCRRIKMANMAYSRKAPGIHREQRKTPHSVSHAGQGYFCSFARSSSSRMGCNRIYNKIKGGTSFF